MEDMKGLRLKREVAPDRAVWRRAITGKPSEQCKRNNTDVDDDEDEDGPMSRCKIVTLLV